MSRTEVAASTLFSRDAARYDELRRRLIPCFDGFYGSALQAIADWAPARPLDILDVGAGTGLFAAMVAERHPVGRLCLLDGSAAMLEQARARFSSAVAVDYRVGDMTTTDPGGPWDLVISALAIHHLDDAAKRRLFSRIRAALKPGGLFINAEQVAGPTPEADARYSRLWLEQIRALGVPEDEVVRAQERMRFDQCSPVAAQLGWMEQAGFHDVDCCFKAWRFAVLSGRAGEGSAR